jgi:hypothetical protein
MTNARTILLLSIPSTKASTSLHLLEPNTSKTAISGEKLDFEKKEVRDERLRNISLEMDHYWTGPVEPENFLDTYLQPKVETVSDFGDKVAEELRQEFHSWVSLEENEFTPQLVCSLALIKD